MRSRQGHPSKHRRVVNGNGPPGPLQARVLQVLYGAKLLAELPHLRKPTKARHLKLIELDDVTVQLRARYGRGLSAMDIARILSDARWGDGVQRRVSSASVSAALSGMMVCGGRYWVSKHPYERWAITKNGLAWL